jgi:hypothetical protein
MRHVKHVLAALALGLAFAPARAATPTIGGCQVFPANNIWNSRVDNLPVHLLSASWINAIGPSAKLHPDWGNVPTDFFGIPFITVTGAQPLVDIIFDVPDESDPGPYPIPPNAPIEGGPSSTGDRHVLVIDTTNCILYELDAAVPQNGGASWTAFSGAKWPLNSNVLRPQSFTSADAAGLPIFPGLVRWEEVAAGSINHAIRFTAQNIYGTAPGNVHQWIWPARHWSGTGSVATNPPMGARFRLKSSFDISTFDTRTQVILRAMQQYGLILADGGSNWFFQGVTDTLWPDIVFTELKTIAGSNFEAVDTLVLQINVDSAQAIQLPGAPTLLQVIAGNAQVVALFTPPASDGGSPITLYTMQCTGAPTVFNTGTASPITVTGMVNGATYTCGVIATNAIGNGPSSNLIQATPTAGSISLATVASRKTHGAVGALDLAIDTAAAIGGAITMEPRAIGAGHSIVFLFSSPVTVAGTATCVDAVLAAVGTATPAITGSSVIVTLTGVPDNQRVTVSLTGVNSTLNASASLGFLVGDVNNSRSVTATDILQVKGRSGQVTDATNFKFDLNASGSITASDILAVKGRSGLVLP